MFEKCKTWFVHSETVAWARFQVFMGIIWGVLAATDLSPVLTGKYMTAWLVINGVVSEYLRRRGTETVNGTLQSKN